jgi:hypothetical protein
LPYGGPWLISRSIGQPLSDYATQRLLCSGNVIHAERNAVRIAEIKLAQISVEVLLFAMLINAFHAALEDRIEAFNGVGVCLAANVFVFAVVTVSWLAKSGAMYL